MKKNNNKSSIFIFRLANLAWKNIWRNKVRSGVILGAIVIGLFAGTFMLAFTSGWMVGSVNSDIETELSHVQIHNPKFLANNDINAYFNRDEVDKKIKESNLPVKVAFRLNLTGMLASPHNAVGVTAKAVWENEEEQVTTVWKQIPDTMGVFLTDNTKNAIVISKKIADKLSVKLRSRIIFTFQDTNGDMQSIAFRITGIYKTSNGMFDEGNVFVRYSDVLNSTGLPQGAVHEAGIITSDLETCQTAAPQLKSMFPNLDVKDWSEINPMLKLSLSYTDFMAVVIVGIFLFALSFGIINTMLMAVLERTRELGMLGAIGMSKGKIFSMIMLETIFLTFLGSMIGLIAGVAVVWSTMHTGIDLTPFMGDQYEDFGFSSIVYPIMNMRMLVQIVILVVIAGILSALYPARKALKLKSLEAIQV